MSKLSLGILLVAHAAVAAFLLFPLSVSYVIPSSSIAPEIGLAYQAPLPLRVAPVWFIPTDHAGAPRVSRLKLFEDGKPLGPPHALHARIREVGSGHYSHWDGAIQFSASDASDPRTNGRTYSVSSAAPVKPLLRTGLLAILATVDLLILIVYRRPIGRFLRANSRFISTAIAGGGALLVVLATLGAFGTIVLARAGAAKDAALIFAALTHAALGCVIALGAWFAAAGLLQFAARGRAIALAELLIPAFPLSLVLMAVLSALGLLVPYGGALALALWLACLLPILRQPPPRRQLRAVGTLLIMLPFALLFGVWQGLLWHGPTATLAGFPTGDLSYYASSIASLAAHPYPFLNLGYEEAPRRSYFNLLVPAVGANFSELPGFDPFLFIAAGGGAAYVLLTGFMLHLIAADRANSEATSPPPFAIVFLLLCLLAAVRYPYWTVESIPMVHLPALTMAVWWMAERSRRNVSWSLFGMAAALVGSALSKVVTAPVLVLLAFGGLWTRVGLIPRRWLILAAAIGVAFALYCAAMLLQFLPAVASAFRLGPESLINFENVAHWRWFIARDLGVLALAVVALRIADLPTAAAIVAGYASFLAFSAVFHGNFVCATLLVGLLAFSHSKELSNVRIPAFAGAGLLLPAVLLTDPAGASSGVVWVLCIGGAGLAALAGTLPPGRFAAVLHRPMELAAVAVAAMLGLGLVGVARGHIIVSSGWPSGTPELTPQVRDIWLAVRNNTPPDALVFTDQVDESWALLGGWNTFASFGQRQTFLTDYYSTFPLRNDPARRKHLLELNRQVLQGAQRASEVPTRRRYSAFFSVVSKTHAAPADWIKLYENRNFVLYRLPP